MLWRQGDIYVETVEAIPEAARQRDGGVLADGELTGHRHQVEDLGTALVFEDRGQLYVDVFADTANIVHEEHGTIQLLRGRYRVWRQREYDPRRAARERIVMD